MANYLSDQTSQSQSYSQSQSGSPDWYNRYMANNVGIGGSLASMPYQPYGGPRIAGFTADQENAANMTRDVSGAWQNYLNPALNQYVTAQGALGDASNMLTQGGTYDQNKYDQFYNANYAPTVQNMQADIDRLGQQNFTNTTLANLNANFTGAGQFGSGRDQILSADAAAMAQGQIEAQKNQLEMGAHQNAMQDYLNWGKQLQTAGTGQLNAARGYQGLGGDIWNLGQNAINAQVADANRLMTLGGMQQNLDQQNLNLAYQDFQNQTQYPWQQMSNWSALTKGQTIPTTSSSVSQSMSNSSGTGYNAIPYNQTSDSTTNAIVGALGALSGMNNIAR